MLTSIKSDIIQKRKYFESLKGQRSKEKNNYQIMKLVIFSKRPYDFDGRQPGERITGNMYGCWRPDGKAFEFSSKLDHKIWENALGYESGLAEDVEIQASIFDGKVKYREKTEV